MALLNRKAQLELTRKGHDLLEKKRTALMQEIMRVATTVLEANAELKQTADQARLALAHAEAYAGFEEVQSAAVAARKEFSIKIDSLNLMGVRVPRIERSSAARSVFERGYSVVGTPAVIDEAAEAFEYEIDAIIQLADRELRLTRLLDEIQRTNRRLNALEQTIIPRLTGEIKYIQLSLEERERSDHFRLKIAKRLLERKKEA